MLGLKMVAEQQKDVEPSGLSTEVGDGYEAVEVETETVALAELENIADSLPYVHCAKEAYVQINTQPNLQRLYSIIVNDDVEALKREIEYVRNDGLSIQKTRNLWVELGSGNDGLIHQYKSGKRREVNMQYNTDWFSAAAYLGAEKCIGFAISEGWGSVSRGIKIFTPQEHNSFDRDERDYYRYEYENDRILTKADLMSQESKEIYSNGTSSASGSLRSLCFSIDAKFDWLSLAKQMPDKWSKIEWAPDIKVGTTEWLKRIVFELHTKECSEKAYKEWCEKEFPRGTVTVSAFAAGLGHTSDIGKPIFNEKTILNFINLGWCNVETLEELRDWFDYKEVDTSEKYAKPITIEAWSNRSHRTVAHPEFVSLLERLQLQTLIPSKNELLHKNVQQVL